MCGIVGCFDRTVAPADAKAALRSVAHRGPDGHGAVEVSDGWLGHTRLAILDLSEAGHQPMTSRDGRWTVTFNGEIYNHLALRELLPGPFRGHSDTETLVEALSAWGVEPALRRLNGMFAFAAWEHGPHRLWLARDPFGIKPLYLAERDGSLAFASEVRGLRALGVGAGEVDPQALQTFLALRFVPSPDTLYAGVRRLPAGHVLRWEAATGSTTTAWARPTTERFTGSFDDAVDAYLDEVRAAVHRQLLSDVPVGVLLSGGIDSALVAALAAERGPVPTFTVGYRDGGPACEIDDAAETARVLGLPHHPVRVDPEDLWAALDPTVQAVEEPLGTTSVLPMWHLVAHARQQVTVVLTGQGSDEPLGGYRRYQAELLRRWLPFPGGLRALAPLRRMALPDPVERGLRTLPVAGVAERFLAAYTLFTAAERRALTGRTDPGDALADIDGWLRWLGATATAPAEQMMRIDARMQLADDLLLYGDKTSMHVALEARVPMLDVDLVRFVESLPLAYRVRLAATKRVHKRAAERFLPAAIVHRPKKGFPIPFAELARTAWRDRIADRLLDPGARHLAILRREGIEAVWTDHVRGRRDATRQLFALLALAAWWP